MGSFKDTSNARGRRLLHIPTGIDSRCNFRSKSNKHATEAKHKTDKFTEMSKNLNEAAMAGNLEEVLLRLNLGEDVNQMLFPRYSTPLHDATTCGRVQVAKILIERGADVNAKDYKGCTPLRLARRYGQDEIERILSQKGAKDEQDPPSRKTSIGPDPPWMSSSRKSSAVTATAPPTRRE